MSGYGISRQDVRAWPTDPEAAEALSSYLDGLCAAPSGESGEVLSGELMDFRGADLSQPMLDGAFLFNTDLSGVRLVGASLDRANLSGAILHGADLTGANLTKAEAVECDARHATFAAATLFAVNFVGADLRSADLRSAIMNSASLGWTRLDGADLRSASLRFCRFGRRDQNATALAGARIANCALDDATGFITGPVDVGEKAPQLIDGTELQAWLQARGAPKITAVARA
ncbi:pentapeptide repeat-containing protein [Actinomadura yumaensis]|uniref:Pentapeptide repeat-containing protein n=1 Tax=Actinomadura yumaensis TaxID=111807 RepID=A0ABW2CFZ0_9ACTN|nr:hypothetical protein [Actinomadura sp. J1-007]